MPVVAGIDLGTTNSCIAVYKDGSVNILKNEANEPTVPSFVFYDPDNNRTIVGKDAINRSALLMGNGVYDSKRLIGQKFNEQHVKINLRRWGFKVVEGRDGECEIEIERNKKKIKIRPEEVSAEILRHLKENAKNALGEKIVDVIITVPAHFNNIQKQATKNAARLAGLNVLKLMPEPTAAALAFASNKDIKERTVLVYDLGGGTFDVSLIKFNEGKGQVVLIGGDNWLGGRDFDRNLLNHVLKEIDRKYLNVDDMKPNQKRRMTRRLKQQCEQMKILLSSVKSVELNLDEISDKDIKLEISRDTFERLNMSLFGDTIKILEQILSEAKINKNQIDDILLIGGSTRIPKIQEMVREFFGGRQLNKSVNPDEAVAIGVAMEAAHFNDILSRTCKNPTFINITPHSLGIEVVGKNTMSVVIPKNSKIPCLINKTYYTCIDFQTDISICIFEGDSQSVKENTFLGEFKIEGITPKPSGEVKIIVKFHLDLNGILKVTAQEDSKDILKDLTIDLINGRLTGDQIVSKSEDDKKDRINERFTKNKTDSKYDDVVGEINKKFATVHMGGKAEDDEED